MGLFSKGREGHDEWKGVTSLMLISLLELLMAKGVITKEEIETTARVMVSASGLSVEERVAALREALGIKV